MMPARVEPCFDTVRKISPGRPSSYSPTVTKPLQSATRNSNVRRRAGAGQLLADRLVDDLLDDPLDDLVATAAATASADASTPAFLAVDSGWADLAVVAVDGDGLEAELPRQSMWSCSTSSTVASSGMLTVLEMAPEMNGWTAPSSARGPGSGSVLSPIEQANTGEVLGGEVRGAEDRLVARRCRRRSRRSASGV